MTDLASEIEEQMGPPIQITEEALAAARESGNFGLLVFELYREGGILVTLCASIQMADTTEQVRFGRNQSICVGLLVRISKLMNSSMKLSSGIEHGETVQILARCIIESSINLLYLLLKGDDEETYDRFVKNSLRPEGELHELILSNIKKRGGNPLLIEQGMLRSIEDTLSISGVKLEDVGKRAPPWGGSFRDRLEALGLGEGYAAIQMVPSHAVHGDWVNLVKSHLTPRDGGFEPDLDWMKTEGELLGATALVASRAAAEYIKTYFEEAAFSPLEDRLLDLLDRLQKVEKSRPDWQEVR